MACIACDGHPGRRLFRSRKSGRSVRSRVAAGSCPIFAHGLSHADAARHRDRSPYADTDAAFITNTDGNCDDCCKAGVCYPDRRGYGNTRRQHNDPQSYLHALRVSHTGAGSNRDSRSSHPDRYHYSATPGGYSHHRSNSGELGDLYD